ncbi:MAG: hypothetical protein Q7U97_14220 [Rhodocyclaceae bacterium]|nr:hypothetical protein [Rhodocyclaceae bacterium]
MNAVIIALVAFALGFGGGWTWRGDRCEVKVQAVDVKNANAREEKVNEARAIEGKQEQTTRRADDAYQKDLAQMAALPVPRRRDTLLGLRQPAAAAAIGVSAPAQDAAVADARTADAVSDPGCGALERDAQKTTLMLWRLQRLLRDEGLADD